jgi:hypothetical protein
LNFALFDTEVEEVDSEEEEDAVEDLELEEGEMGGEESRPGEEVLDSTDTVVKLVRTSCLTDSSSEGAELRRWEGE